MAQLSVVERYEERVAAGEIEPDNAQREVAASLDGLAVSLGRWKGKTAPGLLGAWRGRREGTPRGLYIHGGVGRGKTMLMDLFFQVPVAVTKRRLHFHEFMAEVHERIGVVRKHSPGDAIPAVAKEISNQSALLCLDELQVTDIADAMVLGRLFEALFHQPFVVVATSNVPPSGLYADGLNRMLFLPFIGILEERLRICELRSAKDFRLDKLAGRRLYFTSGDPACTTEIDQLWERLTGHHPFEPVTLEIKGRKFVADRASMGVARFKFSELCERPLGALDYLHIAHTFHTVLLEDVPKLGPERRNEARRLINLVDTLYDNRVCLIVSAEAEPMELYPKGDGALHFERTVSRLIEMRSEAYLSGR